ncbi:MAG: efflux RND transporter periplasmic adaptor subunit [Prevotellaceae bacterium]|jgi:HlyD family secretion protein|nr:efflux RND transporter periplasmic adaptor subunit [Prevotellaceae bacterium]
MDKQISPEILKKRRKKLILRLTIITVAVVFVFAIMVNMFRSSIDLGKLSVSAVDHGSLDITVTATGKVVPLSEEIITSPVASKILRVQKRSGELLEKGDSILQLDLTATNADFKKIRDELRIKKSKLEQLKANIERERVDMKMQIQIDEMKLQRSKVQLVNERFLDSIGSSTQDKIRQAELDFNVQELQFEQLKLRYENQKAASNHDIKVLEIDYNIALEHIGLVEKTMAEAKILAPYSATLTWINDQIGAKVGQGEQLAIISDLGSFKVSATIADTYAEKISAGNQVIVKIGKDRLEGNVGNVVPSVENGMLNFTVSLAQNNHEKLRTGLKVDVFVISAIKDDVLRMENRSFYHGPGSYDIWTVEGKTAYKRKVQLGESSYEKIEIVSGLNEGDVVIMTDMSKYKNEEKISVR